MSTKQLLGLATLVTLLCLSTHPSAFAQRSAHGAPWISHELRRYRSFGMLNGFGWLALTDSAKLSYIDGVRDGIGASYGRARKTPCEHQMEGTLRDLSPNLRAPEIGDMISDFYEEPANLKLAIVDAVEVVVAPLRGIPKDVIAGRISEHRRVASGAPEWLP